MAREKWMPYLWIKWNMLSDTYTNERTHSHKIFVYHTQIDRCIYRNRDNDMQTYEQEPIVQTCQYEFWIEKLQIITVVYNLKIVQQVAIELVWNGLFFCPLSLCRILRFSLMPSICFNFFLYDTHSSCCRSFRAWYDRFFVRDAKIYTAHDRFDGFRVAIVITLHALAILFKFQLQFEITLAHPYSRRARRFSS